MMGNVWEWHETQVGGSGNRGYRGGVYYLQVEATLGSSGGSYYSADYEDENCGFRVASIPEPTTLSLLLIGGLALLRRRSET